MAKARLIKVRRKVRIEGVLFLVFLVCLGIFTLAKTGLASYNIVLSNEQQRVAADKEEQRDAVRLLQTEVNELQERSRVLAAVKEDGIESNQENVYVVGGSEEEE
ncbi:MAG: cell division protein FtsL [Merdibacter sp.]|nr:cell division protein FtsL [Merdibacter sp.]HIY91096.1 cell division protein FtsL [Candidatus Merdibacter merdipullorum]